MKPFLDGRLADGRAVAGVVFDAVDRGAKILNLVDVGARNGNYLLPRSYAARTRITGFEPNRAEYEKLVNGRTDAGLAGLAEPEFRERKYHPYALWSETAERTIYLTSGPGAVTLMGPVDQRMTRSMWRERDRGQTYFDRVQQIVGTDRVPCVTLDQIWQGLAEPIDILKIDAEGGELEVLKGAHDLLASRKILVIFTEFLFVPYYEQRVTLGHQQVFLDERGYRLIALNADHFPYNWGRTAIRAKNDRWLTYAGDAIFVLDPDRNTLDAENKYRLGLACIAMGFNAFGLNLLRASGWVAASDVDALEAAVNRPPLPHRLRLAWMDFPFAVARLLNRLRRV
jgi:FkbM family methyltransferase